MSNQDREAFEEWWRECYPGQPKSFYTHSFKRDGDGKYIVFDVDIKWRAWQACTAHHQAQIAKKD